MARTGPHGSGPVDPDATSTSGRTRPGSAPGPALVPGGPDSVGAPAPGLGGARVGPAPRRPNRLTGRATALLVVVAMLAVAYAWPVKEYLVQRSELAALRAGNAALQDRVNALSAQRQRWADPAYVKAQARDRLHYVLPGETAYVVLQPNRPATPQTLPPPAPPVPVAWYDALWSTVQGADRPPTH